MIDMHRDIKEDSMPKVKEKVVCDEYRRVVELKEEDSNEWNLMLLRQLFEERFVNEIMKVKWPSFHYQHKLIR